jgi:hypothetical protein
MIINITENKKGGRGDWDNEEKKYFIQTEHPTPQ